MNFNKTNEYNNMSYLEKVRYLKTLTKISQKNLIEISNNLYNIEQEIIKLENIK